MRMRALVPIAALIVSLLPGLAYASAWFLAPREYYSELSAGRWSADTFHHLTEGNRLHFPFGGVLEQRSLTFQNEIGWKPWLSVRFGIPVISRTGHVGAPFNFNDTQTALEDMDLGFKIKLSGGRTALAVRGDMLAPLGYTRDALGAVGRGRLNFEGRVLLGTAFAPLNAFVDVDGGYRLYMERLANQFVSSARVGAWMGSSILFVGHYDGAMAVGEGDTPNDQYDQHLVGPEVRYRVDDRLDVFAGSNHTASGKGVEHRDEIYVGIAFRQTTLNRLQGILGNKQRP